jgi:anti-anti-sigma regulatory factor
MEPVAAEVILVLRGSLTGLALQDLGDALERAHRSDAPRVYVDLSAVSEWSMLAQAMVLASARRHAAQGRSLVLGSPSAALRRQSRRLDVFHRVATITRPTDGGPNRC